LYFSGRMLWMAMWWTLDLVVLALVMWALFGLLDSPSHMNESSEDILKRRLAAGEIDVDEYQRLLTALSQTKKAA